MQPQTPGAPLDPRPPPDDRAAPHADGLQLSVAAVARKLGIAPATLRTWDRRYGMGPAAHAPGAHRRYSADDLARLELMRNALLHGATTAAAATYALTTPLPEPDPAPIPDTSTAQAGDGQDVPLSGTGWQARGLARAATALDAEAVRGLLNDAISTMGAQVTWDAVVRPVLRAVGRRWAETGTGIEIEHLLSDCVTGVFSALGASTPVPATTRPVLLAGMAEDQHRLPIVVLSATLAQRGVVCRSLGADVPADALIAAILRTAPIAILLWSELPGTADPDLLTSLPRTRPGFRTFVAGPGWADVALAPQIARLGSLQEATDVMSALALPHHP